MVELLGYLRANSFKTFVVSGGGVEFMRPWVEKAYGIPPEQVVGSSAKLSFELRDGKPVIVKLPELDFVNDKAGKPVGIQKFIGRRPTATFGNSDGDRQMLEWTAAGSGARFALIVHHDDAEREWAYDRKSNVGKLDKALDEANAKGWTIVSMKDDWATIFPPTKMKSASFDLKLPPDSGTGNRGTVPSDLQRIPTTAEIFHPQRRQDPGANAETKGLMPGLRRGRASLRVIGREVPELYASARLKL